MTNVKITDSSDAHNPVIIVKQDKGYGVQTLQLDLDEAEDLLEDLRKTVNQLE